MSGRERHQRPAERDAVVTDLLKLSTSARLVAKTLEFEGPLTYTEIVEAAPIADSTLNRVLNELQEADVVDREPQDGGDSHEYVVR